jgi:hypothetical protein
MTRSFSELTNDLSPERRERVEQRKQQLRQEMTLAGKPAKARTGDKKQPVVEA